MNRFVAVRGTSRFTLEHEARKRSLDVFSSEYWTVAFPRESSCTRTAGFVVFGEQAVSSPSGLKRGPVLEALEVANGRTQTFDGVAGVLIVDLGGDDAWLAVDATGHGEVFAVECVGSTIVSNDADLAFALLDELRGHLTPSKWGTGLFRPASRFTNCRQCPPGFAIHIANGVFQTPTRWCSSAFAIRPDLPRSVFKNVLSAVEHCLPCSTFGLLLSGGVDSGVIASAIGLLGHSNRCLALTFRYPDGLRTEEIRGARAVARSTGLTHYEVTAPLSDLESARYALANSDSHPWHGWWARMQRALPTRAQTILGGAGGDHFHRPVTRRSSANEIINALRATPSLLSLLWQRDVFARVASESVGLGLVMTNPTYGPERLIVHPLMLVANSTAFSDGTLGHHKLALRTAFSKQLPKAVLKRAKFLPPLSTPRKATGSSASRLRLLDARFDLAHRHGR